MKLSDNNNFLKDNQEKIYGEKLRRFEPRIRSIMSADEDQTPLQRVENLVKYFDSIKQQVLRLIKKPSGAEPKKKKARVTPRPTRGQPSDERPKEAPKEVGPLPQPPLVSVNKLNDASTKMTEEDRVMTNIAFVLEAEGVVGLGGPPIQKKPCKNEKIGIFDLTTDIELPRVRPRSNSFHLGKRRFNELKEIDRGGYPAKFLKSCERGGGKLEAFGSPFFVMTNRFYKDNEALLGVRVKNM